MRKTSAVISLVCTVIIIFSGIFLFAHGAEVKIFGIKLSPGVFGGVVAGFIAYDIIAMKRAFGEEKKIAEQESAAMARNVELNAVAGALEVPCTVTFTRIACAFGCAMGVQVYLNGTLMATVKNGQTISMTTFVRYNELSVHYTADGASRSISFEAVPGGNVQINLKYIGAKLSIVTQ